MIILEDVVCGGGVELYCIILADVVVLCSTFSSYLYFVMVGFIARLLLDGFS